jgi:ferrochelatase
MTGVLLLQLGTPASPSTGDVRRYLREFLSDPLVIDLSAPARWLLVNTIIAPFRAPKSAAAYQKIWMEEGSPLLFHTEALAGSLRETLGGEFRVEVGMRYGAPEMQDALARLSDASVDRILAVPLFPHDAQSSSGSAEQRVRELHAALGDGAPPLQVLGSFPTDPGFIGSITEVARPVLDEFGADHVLFSYHGLPERHIRKADPGGSYCLESNDCCAALGSANSGCYRAQCHATTRAVAAALGLDPAKVSTSFQSRLGRDPWIQPFTDFVLPELAEAGVRRLAVLCPSFVADCLETVEEIGIRGRDQWLECGGEELALVPCVNSESSWVRALAARIRRS